eukprot:Plantae.Rhodophyta-Purpureofilum_apyrenoidigerum.ctg12775.p1 GENE.Plantae.Rhodophyta-Purpureofilum_apyrenoidigerum.ctg12775~~Plantae.Rhodophyta-Purpureofilum_apyrenoidigerum.ctg12775.p1  ORF type:complete len:443 (-),score=80.47 Plantae.Rhodophyta-Purpureofilum_apyrenoidigerum.ctg12775:100-1428(-)
MQTKRISRVKSDWGERRTATNLQRKSVETPRKSMETSRKSMEIPQMATSGQKKTAETPLMKGWLEEKSGIPLCGGWYKRYFVLHGNKLQCFQDQQSTKPMWVINVLDAEVLSEKSELKLNFQQKSTRQIKLRAKSLDDLNSWLGGLDRRGKHSAKNFYMLDNHIGSGAHSTVRMGVDRFTGKAIAVKTIRVGTDNTRRLMVDREVAVLRNVRHKCIISALDTFKRNKEVNIITEFASGGTLEDLLKSRDQSCLTERETRYIIASVIDGLKYLHNKQIIHRDIKPTNILLMKNEAPYDAKISDFGIARYVFNTAVDEELIKYRRERIECAKTHCGTPAYVAPDIFNENDYGTEVDVWSVGALMYRILSGQEIHSASNLCEAADILPSFELSFDDPVWNHISSEAKDLITKMLEVDGSKRITMEQALNHDWMKLDSDIRRQHTI